MRTIKVGEVWTILLADQLRGVTVVASTDAPGWWRCLDIQTGIAFAASERWFHDRVPEPAGDRCAATASQA